MNGSLVPAAVAVVPGDVKAAYAASVVAGTPLSQPAHHRAAGGNVPAGAGRGSVNGYGRAARRHWERWLPEQYAIIEDPEAFFAALDEEAAAQVDELAAELAGDGPPGEGYLERAGRLASARARAQEIVLPQRVLPPPEALADDEQDDDEGVRLEGGTRPLAVDPWHPSWAEVDAEQRERAGRPAGG